MWTLFIVIGIFIVLVIQIVAAAKMRDIAYEKGSTDDYFAWCFFLPMIGYAMVIALPDIRTRVAIESMANSSAAASLSVHKPPVQKSKTMEDELPEL